MSRRGLNGNPAVTYARDSCGIHAIRRAVKFCNRSVVQHQAGQFNVDRAVRLLRDSELDLINAAVRLATTPGTSLASAACRRTLLNWRPAQDRDMLALIAAPEALGRMTKASSPIAVALLLINSAASATECQSSPDHDGKWWSYRIVDSKRCWYQGRPGRSKDVLHWAKQSPPPVVTRPDPGDSPHPAPPVPPQQPAEIVGTTPKVVSTVSIPATPTSKAPQMAAPPPSLPEPPPLSATPTPTQPSQPLKQSKWWILLLIIPAIATGLTVVASRFQPAKNRRWWTNSRARMAGHLDLMGDSLTQWSRRALRPVQIDSTSSSSERPSPRPWYKLHKSKPIAPTSCSNRPSSPLTTFDPKSLVVPEMNDLLIAFGDSLLAW